MRSLMNTLTGLGLIALGNLVAGCGSDESDGAPPDEMGEEQMDNPLSELPPVDKLVAALGGGQAIVDLSGLRVVSSGTRYLPHEGARPEDPAVEANTFQRTVSVDFANDFLRVDTDREVQFLFAATEAYSDIVRGNLGVTTQTIFGTPVGNLSSDKVAAIQVQEMLLHPHVLLKRFGSAGIQEGIDVQQDDLGGGARHHRLQIEGARPILLYVDAATGQLSRLETVEHDFYRRDVTVRVDYAGWMTTESGVGYPTSVRLSRAGQRLLDADISVFQVNPAFDAQTFDFPPMSMPTYDEGLFARGARSHQWYFLLDSIGLPFAGIDTAVNPVEIAPGVHQLQGGSHHSFLVEQAEGLVLVDAPLYEDRGRALFQFIEGRFPNKPITHVVASHFHEDHAAGIREVLGATEAALVVHESTVAWWQGLLEARSIISPDALARSQREVEILTVPDDDSLTLDDAEHPVELYDMNSQHASDLLLARDATSNTVFVVDIYSPGNGDPFEPQTVDATIVDNAIPTEDLKIVGGHGTEVHDYATLQGFLDAGD